MLITNDSAFFNEHVLENSATIKEDDTYNESSDLAEVTIVIPFLRDIIAVDAGSAHSVALRKDGTVWTWGANELGQLGNGTLETSPVPVQVMFPDGDYITGIVQIAAGEFHTVALKKDGTVWTWGCNGYGQLGDDTETSKNHPVQVKGPGGVCVLSGIIAVAAGGRHTVALKDDGTVWAWGHNVYGQLGNGGTGNSRTPAQVVRPDGDGYLTGLVAVACGYEHTMSLRCDGTLWTWGRNHYGQLGDGNDGEGQQNSLPVQVTGPGIIPNIAEIVDFAGGWVHSVALDCNGVVWTWGRNQYGQLGDGTNVNASNPVQAVNSDNTGLLREIVFVAAGYQHTATLDGNGTVWSWGKNEYGQLGDGAETNRNTPVRVKDSTGEALLTDIIQIASGWDHTIALRDDGTVWTWGRNTSGQLGNGEMCQYVNRSLPVQVIAPEDWYKKYF